MEALLGSTDINSGNNCVFRGIVTGDFAEA